MPETNAGHNFKFGEGIGSTCAEDVQNVPVGEGMSTIKLDKMTVGGTGR
jgi:TldD protein